MRISDWSSDVCSSDLVAAMLAARPPGLHPHLGRRSMRRAGSLRPPPHGPPGAGRWRRSHVHTRAMNAIDPQSAFRYRATEGAAAPAVFDSPHRGTEYPDDFRSIAPLSVLRCAEDTIVAAPRP